MRGQRVAFTQGHEKVEAICVDKEADANIKMAGNTYSAKLNAWAEGSRVRLGTTVCFSIISRYYCAWHPLLPKS